MTLQQLRYFIATVECGCNVSRAAEALQTSQPGVSRQLKLLEQELGTPLLARQSARFVGLTKSGERAYESARRVLKETDGLLLMGADETEPQSGRMTIAALHTFAYALLPRAIGRLRPKYPGVVFEIRQASPAHIVELVLAGEADLGLSMRTFGLGDAGIVTLPFLKTPRFLLAPKGHPLLARQPVTIDDLARYPFVAQTELSAGGWAVSNRLRALGVTLDIAVLASDASLIKAHVEGGLGVAIMSSLLYDPERDRGLGAADVSHLFEPSEVILQLDPYRYHRGYVLDLVESLAPDWPRQRVAAEIKRSAAAHGGAFAAGAGERVHPPALKSTSTR